MHMYMAAKLLRCTTPRGLEESFRLPGPNPTKSPRSQAKKKAQDYMHKIRYYLPRVTLSEPSGGGSIVIMMT